MEDDYVTRQSSETAKRRHQRNVNKLKAYVRRFKTLTLVQSSGCQC